jgi:hypothetical protein
MFHPSRQFIALDLRQPKAKLAAAPQNIICSARKFMCHQPTHLTL